MNASCLVHLLRAAGSRHRLKNAPKQEKEMELVQSRDEILANAFLIADAIRDGDVDEERAKELFGWGRVYLPFRYGDQLAFAPAKFIGFRDEAN